MQIFKNKTVGLFLAILNEFIADGCIEQPGEGGWWDKSSNVENNVR